MTLGTPAVSQPCHIQVTMSDRLCLEGYEDEEPEHTRDVMMDSKGVVLHTTILQDSLGALLCVQLQDVLTEAGG